jgi:hypothetical protein
VVIPDRKVVVRDFAETDERPNSIAIVIQDRDVHFQRLGMPSRSES